MCGIAGFCDFGADFLADAPAWLEVLEDMRASLKRRGHDDVGRYLAANAGLSHTRLAIRDLAQGAQPIARRRGEADCAIVYNGEIYNTDEIKQELKALGYAFETATDTEAILYAYMQWGEECVHKLNGIFAFAIWDAARNKLVLCRDRAGVKPLFYALNNGALVFGSEIKALFEHPGINPELDADSFREIFALGPARTPGHGVFKGVNEVKPGHYLVFSADAPNKIKEARYWELESRPHTDSYERTLETVRFLVRDAVIRQMVSDVPICSFLSGGVDSSIVTAIAADCLKRSGAVLNTFSFDFKENDRYFVSNSFQPDRDTPYVLKMLETLDAGDIGVNHTFLECGEADLAAALYSAVDAKDLPGMADVDASLLYFCSLVKERNKVALTGECADEIFGGYPWFYRPELTEGEFFPWSRDMAARTALLSDDFIRPLKLEEYALARYRDSVAAVPRLPGEPSDEARRREIGYLNIKWFMQTLLDRMDRTSMHSGLEARVPYADHRIMEYVWNVPWGMKYRDGRPKHLLRQANADLLPPELLNRRKSPYPKTYHPEYERILTDVLREILADPNAPVKDLIDGEKTLAFIRAFKAKTPSEYGRPWFGQLMASPQMLAYIIQVNYWMTKFRLSVK